MYEESKQLVYDKKSLKMIQAKNENQKFLELYYSRLYFNAKY